VKDGTKYGIGAEGQKLDWDSIDWAAVERRVTSLRQRIFRATREQKWNQVRSLMKLMLRSRSNLLLSVRRVTQTNRGKSTQQGARDIDPANGRTRILEGETVQTNLHSESW
jgi:RNA-directed DNA polymerase